MMETNTTLRTTNMDLLHVRLPFPWKLHQLLDDVEVDGNEHIISWLPDGNGFKVHKPMDFTESILHSYFRQTKFKSFTRQLYIYGFLRVQHGPNRGAFCHPKFVRGNQQLCLAMERNHSDNNKSKSKVQPKGINLDESVAQEAMKIGNQRFLAGNIKAVNVEIDQQNTVHTKYPGTMKLAPSKKTILDLLCQGVPTLDSSKEEMNIDWLHKKEPLASDVFKSQPSKSPRNEWNIDLISLEDESELYNAFDFEPRPIEAMMSDGDSRQTIDTFRNMMA